MTNDNFTTEIRMTNDNFQVDLKHLKFEMHTFENKKYLWLNPIHFFNFIININMKK